MKLNHTSVCLAPVLLVSLGIISAHAALIGPTYPAPGLNNFSGSGVPGNPGGRVNSYSGFNTAFFSELYWGPSAFGSISSFLSEGGGVMTFSTISGNTATWLGTATYWNTPSTTANTQTKFTATVDSAATPWVLANTLSGLTVPQAASLGAVVNNSSGLDYSVTLEFFALYGTSWIALNTFDNIYDYGSGTRSDVYGGFYYAAPVPEPTTMIAGALLLLPFGMSTIRFLRKQRPA